MKVVVVSGPTASGKTNIAIELAMKFGGEIVNFDSLLLYKEINIGTAKPSFEERRTIPHHMIDVTSIKTPMNAADYAREAFPLIERLLGEKKIVYLVGGSGFYLQALIKGMYESSTTPTDIASRSEKLFQEEGIAPFLSILSENDPVSLERYHKNDHYRIRRAVEHWWTTGTPLSEVRKEKDQSNQKLKSPTIHNWDILHIYLDIPKGDHLKIIENRTDRMIKDGLVEEVQNLITLGFTGQEKPLQSIGYKETLEYLSGQFKTVAEYRERIIISTRQLAKSQRTWFNRDDSRMIFNPFNERTKIFHQVETFLRPTNDQL